MKYILYGFYPSVALFLANCRGQSKYQNDKVKAEKVNTLSSGVYPKNSSHRTAIDLKSFKQLRDTGSYVNNVKEGNWTEYAIDSSGVQDHYKFVVNGDTTNWNFDLVPQMQVGRYQHGRKEGV